MSHKAADRIRNVALIGHRDCGKTSLAEAMLYEAGAINRLGRTETGNTVSDFEPDEQERGMSIGASICSFEHGDRKINLIDTPGDPSFVAEALGALAVADAAVVVVSAVDGVQVHTERLWAQADRAGLPRLVFVNMLDRERADFFRALEGLQESFGSHVVATEIPIGAEHEVSGVIDLIDMRAFLHDSDGRGEEVEAEIPAELQELAQQYREKLMDEVAENSDALMEHYLEGEEISHEETVAALKKGVTEGHLFPVTCGIATRDLGIERLLQALIEDLPSPAMRGARTLLGEEDAEVEVLPDEDGPLIAQVFKTTADPFTGRHNALRVLSGTLRSDSHVHNERTGAKERIGQLGQPLGKELSTTDELGAGDIGIVAKLKETRAGDLLCEPPSGLRAPRVELPSPVMAYAYEPKSKGDEDKAVTAIRRLREEDPCLDVHRDPQTGEQIIAGLTQIHVDVVLGRMRDRFGAEIVLKPPRVPYVETIRRLAKAHARYKKQTGGRGQFADCVIEIEPGEPGAGLVFENAIKGGVIPGGFIPAVEKGVVEAMQHGSVAGYPVKDLKVRLVDGSHHSVDSSEMAFKICGSMALKEALADADAILLEPIVRLAISVPEEAVGDVIGDLSSRRGHPLGMSPRLGVTEIDAEAPLSEVLDYALDLRAITGGRGEYTIHFERYEELPGHLAAGVIAAAEPREELAAH
ncbi:MAG: elongation factor G [Solirubrobacterales bacterium]|nr:elongation factor G [Thermoleophilales bacterium]MCO5325540.1 elongation factor G [Solirubrobacterales bacterium]